MLLAFVAAAVAAPGLDAPVVPQQPTIRSEIIRGMDAATDCHRFSPVSEMETYTGCIDAAHSRNRQQMGTGYEAFDVGLYRAARDAMGIVVDVLRHQSIQAIDPVSAKLSLDVEQSGYEAAKAALGLSDQQIDGATR